jgi:hypothetical protein
MDGARVLGPLQQGRGLFGSTRPPLPSPPLATPPVVVLRRTPGLPDVHATGRCFSLWACELWSQVSSAAAK